ncbi:hypothetical protein EVAR_4419_1 [Eumeta japonica]|uniref:Uncharacterized protein n=1 Tax=Eumeta variegata TaxID=151549 RepID=A0A4C1T0G2_EUMVA|nr:hypothetical protein EVAR_4419_1 [Eumeta japonica]
MPNGGFRGDQRLEKSEIGLGNKIETESEHGFEVENEKLRSGVELQMKRGQDRNRHSHREIGIDIKDEEKSNAALFGSKATFLTTGSSPLITAAAGVSLGQSLQTDALLKNSSSTAIQNISRQASFRTDPPVGPAEGCFLSEDCQSICLAADNRRTITEHHRRHRYKYQHNNNIHTRPKRVTCAARPARRVRDVAVFPVRLIIL